MFKKIFRFSVAAVGLVTKFVPQTLLISVVSEVAAVALEALDNYTKSKKDSDSKKALQKMNNKVVFITEALVNHSDSDFDNELFKQVKNKVGKKKKRLTKIYY